MTAPSVLNDWEARISGRSGGHWGYPTVRINRAREWGDPDWCDSVNSVTDLNWKSLREGNSLVESENIVQSQDQKAREKHTNTSEKRGKEKRLENTLVT